MLSRLDRPGGGDRDDAASAQEFATLLDARDVDVLFQPLIDLSTREIVAFEALARGPVGSQFYSPSELFGAARRYGRVAELDWVCRAAAFRAFLKAELPASISLFVNVEPEGIAGRCPPDLVDLVAQAEAQLRVFVEINDKALADDPAGVLAAADHAREMGWGIAIDDVGSSRAPIAMLPLVLAEVVKLDLRRLELLGKRDASAIVTAVLRHVEKTGASLLVEGIENNIDARWARALGASYGQGMHLGPPAPLRAECSAPLKPVRLSTRVPNLLDIASPFDLFDRHPHQKMARRELDELILTLAYSPRTTGTWPIFLTCVGRDRKLPHGMIEGGVPADSLLFVTFGTNLRGEPAPGVRGVRLPQDDPLADERFLIVLSDQAPVAIFARTSPEGMLDVVVTQKRDLVYDIAHHLIRRVPKRGRNNYANATSTFLPPYVDEPPAVPKSTWSSRWRRKS